MHQLIKSLSGSKRRGDAVDEQLKLCETWAAWAAIWRANTPGPALAWLEDDGPLFHRPSTDAMCRIIRSFRAVTALGYDAVPPRALSELPDQDLIKLIEEKCEWPVLCDRIVF